jgi:tetratricopeptide (TPR) repeat protein
MSFFGKWNRWLLAAALAAAVGGCSPLDSNPLDEEKEPHYVLGKSRVNAMDYDGAIRAFEESLETNPHSAQAHYQLAVLYENQEADPAAAIFHYQQYLKYDPKANNADVIQQHIASCKQQLATDVLQLPSAPAAQQQLEKLTEENRRLHEQLAQWKTWFDRQPAAARTNSLALESTPAPQTNYSAPALPTNPPPDVARTQPGAATAASANSGLRATGPTPPARVPQPRTHSVVRGETLATIARKQGVSLPALEAANPSVNPKKLRAGQVLILPPQ